MREPPAIFLFFRLTRWIYPRRRPFSMPTPILSRNRSAFSRQAPFVLLCLALVALVLSATSSGAQSGMFVQSTWRDTIYYRATFSAEEATDGFLHVAAADGHEVFFNGVRAGSDSVLTRLASYPVTINGGGEENHIGIIVINSGGGGGNGVTAAVVANDSTLSQTTTNRRIQTWFWTGDPQTGTEWTTVDVEEEGWEWVQEGTMDTNLVSNRGEGTGDLPQVIAGQSGAVDIGAIAGSVVLARTRGVNLALGKPSNHPEVVDGDLSRGWNAPPSALSFSGDVDLQDRRLIDRIRVITLGRNAREFEEKSLRGYSVQVSDDQVRWTEVGVRHDIGCIPGVRSPCTGTDVDPAQYLWSQVVFRPTWTRFVRFVIVDVSPGNRPAIGEFEVFGDGFADEGLFLSRPLAIVPSDVGKNFGRVRWEATVPERTQLSVQLRTGDTIADFDVPDSGWSQPDSSGAWYPAVEPARLLQYRVSMATNDHNLTPRFEHLEIEYDTDLAVTRALGRVSPNRVAMGVDTTFTYHLDLEFEAGDLGIERLNIEVPSEARLADGAAISALLSGWESTQQTLALTFAPPLTESTQLEIPLRTQTHASAHDFRAAVFGPGADPLLGNPLNVTQNQTVDALTGKTYSWSVAASTTADELLSRVRANPAVITPNDDEVNDHTVIEFVLSVVDTPTDISIQIFDLNGRRVRDLRPAPVAAGAFAGPGAPGSWDGTDDSGSKVAPGLYLFRVEADLDTGNETKSGVIAVAY